LFFLVFLLVRFSDNDRPDPNQKGVIVSHPKTPTIKRNNTSSPTAKKTATSPSNKEKKLQQKTSTRGDKIIATIYENVYRNNNDNSNTDKNNNTASDQSANTANQNQNENNADELANNNEEDRPVSSASDQQEPNEENNDNDNNNLGSEEVVEEATTQPDPLDPKASSTATTTDAQKQQPNTNTATSHAPSDHSNDLVDEHGRVIHTTSAPLQPSDLAAHSSSSSSSASAPSLKKQNTSDAASKAIHRKPADLVRELLVLQGQLKDEKGFVFFYFLSLAALSHRTCACFFLLYSLRSLQAQPRRIGFFR
jgi:hypothetical protein